MLATRELARLVAHAGQAGAKLVLVGDHRQLPEIEAGGAFRALVTRLPVIELRENRRQAEQWERDALALLRDARGAEALERYQAHGRVVADADADAIRQRLVADWWAARDPDRSVMIAHRRSDVDELNGRADAGLGCARQGRAAARRARVRRGRRCRAAAQRPGARRRQR